MEIAVEEGDVTTVGLKGRLDGLTAKAVEERLLQLVDAGQRRLVIDLAQVDYVSSVGLRVLMLLARRLKPVSGKVVVCSLQEAVQEVFEISGFTLIFAVYKTRAEAVSGVQ